MGIDMVFKSYFTIANNTFARQGSTPGYVDIAMEDVRNSFISENVFSRKRIGANGYPSSSKSSFRERITPSRKTPLALFRQASG